AVRRPVLHAISDDVVVREVAVRVVRDDARLARAHVRPIGCRVAERDRAPRSWAAGEGSADGLVAEGTLDDDVDTRPIAGTALESGEVRGTDDRRGDRRPGHEGVVRVVEHVK